MLTVAGASLPRWHSGVVEDRLQGLIGSRGGTHEALHTVSHIAAALWVQRVRTHAAPTRVCGCD
jgi:hypothetical protein